MSEQNDPLANLRAAKYLNPECAEHGCQWLKAGDHSQCESDKNWLRAQRDVAEEKLREERGETATMTPETFDDLIAEMRERVERDGPQHPLVAAWHAWKRDNPTLFNGSASGEYLSNRINAAFTAGWIECEQAVTDALGISTRVGRRK